MARAVPRKVNEVKLFTGDIQGLCTGRDKVFACTSKGAIRYCSSPMLDVLQDLDLSEDT